VSVALVPTVHATVPRPAPTTAAAVRSLADELVSLLTIVPADRYCVRAGEGVPTIGEHVAHVVGLLDSLASAGAASPALVYGRRPVGMDRDPVAALRAARSLRNAFVRWPARGRHAPIRVAHASGDPEDGEGWSTLDIEAAFVVSAIVDRHRSIARLMTRLGLTAPRGFGMMPFPPLRTRSAAPMTAPLARLLDELASVAARVTIEAYRGRPYPRVSGTVGEHIRHCLDHVAALVRADPANVLSYDHRERATSVETDPAAALQQMASLRHALDRLPETWADEPVRVASLTSTAGDVVAGASTFARELAFVLSHTIHHQAMIALLLAVQGEELPERFGHSPSTPTRH
jgi:uncharacterized damage-inducible protein DinB